MHHILSIPNNIEHSKIIKKDKKDVDEDEILFNFFKTTDFFNQIKNDKLTMFNNIELKNNL